LLDDEPVFVSTAAASADQADGSPTALAANLATEEWTDIPKSVPIMMGEFGCNINWYPNATQCAPNVRQLQISSCAAGFTSWLFWTYDSNDVQPDWYGMIDDDGAIDSVLAPINHPDPCKAAGAAAACNTMLDELCGRAQRASIGDCLVCCGQNQSQLLSAGCQESAMDSFCGSKK
jgi:hypothetical protein